MVCYGSESEAIYIELIVSSSLTLVCSIFIIIFCLCFDILESFSRKILLYLSFNNTFRALMIIISANRLLRDACFILAYINSICLVSNVIWALSIPVTLYMVLIKGVHDIEKYHIRWVLCCYGVLPCVLAIPFSTNSYGVDGLVCALKENYVSYIWSVTLIYVPSWILIAAIIALYMKLYRHVRRKKEIKYKSIITDRGMIYSLIIGFSMIPMTLIRLIYLFHESCTLNTLYSFSLGLIHLQGFFNLIGLALNANVQKAIKHKLKRNKSDVFDLTSFESFTLST
ncbi:hypothetical protein SteCoe_31623 [Stentor coeruleus]|uniref:G-protein coupled receptors family 2 profile 2 domain-containing protein n=1 Tax=Stentor coeruleus TaxID=5963 RepID=A0A1R2B0V9_9CILI|nr:hypothetical protein SteCoe_31623 [Stentor coeruleus]